MNVDPRPFLNPSAILVRREPDPDAPAWSRVVVCGFQGYDGDNAGPGMVEVVVRPIGDGGFHEAVSVDVTALADAYDVAAEGEPEKPLETPLLDVLLRKDSTVNTSPAAPPATADDEPPGLALRAWRQYRGQTTPEPQEGTA
jgi:hypothetical protein